jgi:Protein of unknown function with PCYCGC motif
MQRRQFFHSSFLVGLSSFGLATQLSAQTTQRSYDKYREPPLSEDALKTLPASFQEAYLFAKTNPKILKQFPCYCGCGQSVGHKSNLDCFVFADGVYNSHGSRCDVCVDVALTAKRDGHSGIPIRTSIKNLNLKYRGAPRMTGFPT